MNTHHTMIGWLAPGMLLFAFLVMQSGCGSAKVERPETDQDSVPSAPVTAKEDVTAKEEVAAEKPATASTAPTSPAPQTDSQEKTAVDIPAFWDAALAGNIDAVQQAIDAGVDVNAADDQKRTALLLAAFNGHTDVVKRLKENGALMTQQDAMGRTALMFASTGPYPETVEFLLESGADVNAVDTDEKFTALMHAAAEGQTKVVQTLLKYKADPNLKDIDGDTALSFATQNRHVEVIQLLSK